jgi:phenylalanyl-tRNA synthetase beta chain
MKTSLQWLEDYLPGARELGAERAAEALMNGGLPVESIEKVGDDTVLDVEVTSNRSDCLSHLGVARELGALVNKPWRGVTPKVKESATPASAVTSVRIEAPDLCPYYCARLIRGAKIGPSPAWMVRRLEAVGLRPINNVADVTNYVLFELGQPLHAFDFDRLQEKRIVVRGGVRGEKLTSIDGKVREVTADMLVIADARRPVAVAGVMGGKETEVGDGTLNVLLESARFDPLSVRKTSRALALRSDSSYRFERGIDPTLADLASLRAAQLILETAGGELLAGAAAAGEAMHRPARLALRLSKLRAVLGIDVPADSAVDALRRQNFSPVLKGDVIECTVPSWRLDVGIEVDLVEEVARTIGYQAIPIRETIEVRLTPPQQDLKAIESIRGSLVAAGYFEALTFSWVSDPLRDDFRPPDAPGLLRADASVRKDNAHLRPSMLPGLLEAVRRNESVGNPRARLFEIGSTYWVGENGQVDERRRVALVGGPDYRQVRGAVEAMLEILDADRPVRIVPDQRPGFSSAATGRVEWRGKSIGWIGMVDRAVADKLGLREAPVAAELELSPLIEGAQWLPQVRDPPKFPAVRRDLSLVVAERVRYDEIESAVRDLKLPHLQGVEYVTTFRGKPVGEGSKSVTVQLVFRSDTGTLTSEEVEVSVQKVVGAAKGKGWGLRE